MSYLTNNLIVTVIRIFNKLQETTDKQIIETRKTMHEQNENTNKKKMNWKERYLSNTGKHLH